MPFRRRRPHTFERALRRTPPNGRRWHLRSRRGAP
jgi:hypothetical protein